MFSESSLQRAPRVRAIPLPPMDVDYHDADVLQLSLKENRTNSLPPSLILSPYRPDAAALEPARSKGPFAKPSNARPHISIGNVSERRVVYPQPMGDVNWIPGRRIG
ncbi:hypothetical protein CPB84DRAFT_1780391 [Gymnopilus junonius]|uniref:Uncharacterized protein n=1 Tax=Gymnopilus junonius TaxID=109634 RepID=A0A9P5TMT8_GYMJU|nr:hypothetical protein CPB84DRAFT_1780391 [Gymnopilus junonius]